MASTVSPGWSQRSTRRLCAQPASSVLSGISLDLCEPAFPRAEMGAPGLSAGTHSAQRGEGTCTGSQLPDGGARTPAQAFLASQNHIPSLQLPSKGGSRHHHFVFCQGGRLAACQSPASGSQVLTKHRPEQEGGVEGLQGERRAAPSPATPGLHDELRAAGAALADNSKLRPPLLGRQWVTLSTAGVTQLPPLPGATPLSRWGPELGVCS